MDLLIEECSEAWNKLAYVAPSCLTCMQSICMTRLLISSTNTPWEVLMHSMEIDNASHGDDHER